MSECFPKPKPLWENVTVELGLSNYATKTDLKTSKMCTYIRFC